MKPQTTWIITSISLLVLALTIALMTNQIPKQPDTFGDDAAVLSVITGSAIAIERLIEGFWTVLGGSLGSYWPLTIINQQVDTLEDQLEQTLNPIFKTIHTGLDSLEEGRRIGEDLVKKTQAEISELKTEVEQLQRTFINLKALPKDNQRSQLLIATANQIIGTLTVKYETVIPEINNFSAVAATSINGLQAFLGSFKDNPGRRLISLFLGVIIGVVVAGYFGLDLFKAVLETSAYSQAQIIVTGIIIGLGANPTHEVIRVIQEYKKAQKSENIIKPNLPTKATAV